MDVAGPIPAELENLTHLANLYDIQLLTTPSQFVMKHIMHIDRHKPLFNCCFIKSYGIWSISLMFLMLF